jgi:hypothetical protein
MRCRAGTATDAGVCYGPGSAEQHVVLRRVRGTTACAALPAR